jgi:AcrR family transcriptional regulator
MFAKNHYKVELSLPACLFVRDPQSSELGKMLAYTAAKMIGETGIEAFTLLKLAKNTGCTEATVYRYFSGKQQLLYYLMNLYWGYVLFGIEFHIKGEKSDSKRLNRALDVLLDPNIDNFSAPGTGQLLKAVAISEGIRIHLRPEVSEEIEQGKLKYYVELIDLFELLIHKAHPGYSYSRSLAGTLIDASLQQSFYQIHNTPLTDKSCISKGPSGFIRSLLPIVD